MAARQAVQHDPDQHDPDQHDPDQGPLDPGQLDRARLEGPSAVAAPRQPANPVPHEQCPHEQGPHEQASQGSQGPPSLGEIITEQEQIFVDRQPESRRLAALGRQALAGGVTSSWQITRPQPVWLSHGQRLEAL